jgi:hypothetical protein
MRYTTELLVDAQPVEPHHGQTLATIQIDFSLGIEVLDLVFRFFIEWGLHKVSKRSMERGLRKRCPQQTVMACSLGEETWQALKRPPRKGEGRELNS